MAYDLETPLPHDTSFTTHDDSALFTSRTYDSASESPRWDCTQEILTVTDVADDEPHDSDHDYDHDDNYDCDYGYDDNDAAFDAITHDDSALISDYAQAGTERSTASGEQQQYAQTQQQQAMTQHMEASSSSSSSSSMAAAASRPRRRTR